MQTAERVGYGWPLAIVALALGFVCTSVDAETITSQTFTVNQSLNLVNTQVSWTNGLGKNRRTYSGAGLGFEAATRPSGDGLQATGGALVAGHMSTSAMTFDGTPGAKYTPPGGISFNNNRSGFALFDAADLSGHSSSILMLTLELTTTVGASSGNDDSIFVRLFLDGSTSGIDVLTMYGNSNTTAVAADTTFAGDTLTYTFDDNVLSAELFIGFSVDDSSDYYIIDNVSFEATPGPPPGAVFIIR